MITILTMIMGWILTVNTNRAELGQGPAVYTTTTIVTDVDYNTDVFVTMSVSGNIYTFNGVEDWFEGDLCSMLMIDINDTPEDISDDYCVYYQYVGNYAQFNALALTEWVCE